MKTKDILLLMAGVIILFLWAIPLGLPLFGKLWGTVGLIVIFFILSKIFTDDDTTPPSTETCGGDWVRT